MNDEIEIPIQRCLYRQSSTEQRLSPANISDESDYENETSYEKYEDKKPVIVASKLKETEKRNDDHSSQGNLKF